MVLSVVGATNVSLAPVIVKLAEAVAVAAPSVTCTVKLSLTAWPAARAWVAALALSRA